MPSFSDSNSGQADTSPSPSRAGDEWDGCTEGSTEPDISPTQGGE